MTLKKFQSQPPASTGVREKLRAAEANPQPEPEDSVLFTVPVESAAREASQPIAPPKVNSQAPEALAIELVIGNQRYYLPQDCHLSQEDIDRLLAEDALSTPKQVSKGNNVIRKMQRLSPSKAEQVKSKRRCLKPMDWWIPAINKLDRAFSLRVRNYMSNGGTEAFLHSAR